MCLTRRDFAETEAQPGESGGFVDYTQTIATVRVTALLTEVSGEEAGSGRDGQVLTKISLRSKNPLDASDTDIDVNRVCQTLGGGGHVRAAGARLPMDLAAAKAMVLAAVRQAAASRGT
jgi:phosphoesterase RecJ-like protein